MKAPGFAALAAVMLLLQGETGLLYTITALKTHDMSRREAPLAAGRDNPDMGWTFGANLPPQAPSRPSHAPARCCESWGIDKGWTGDTFAEVAPAAARAVAGRRSALPACPPCSLHSYDPESDAVISWRHLDEPMTLFNGLAWVGKGSKLQLVPALNTTYSEAGRSYEVAHSFACMTASRDLIGAWPRCSCCRPVDSRAVGKRAPASASRCHTPHALCPDLPRCQALLWKTRCPSWSWRPPPGRVSPPACARAFLLRLFAPTTRHCRGLRQQARHPGGRALAMRSQRSCLPPPAL